MQTSRFTSTLRSREPARPERQAGRDDRGQQLGRDADRDREREQQRVEQRPAQHEIDDEDRRGEHGRDLREQRREVAQPGLELRLGLTIAEPERDATELGATAGGDHDADRRAFVHHGAHEGARCELAERRARGHGFGLLGHRERLAGEHRLVALERDGVQQPQIGRHHGTDRQLDDVAGHEVDDVDGRRGAVTPHRRRGDGSASGAPATRARRGTR